MYDSDAVWTITATDGTTVTLAGPAFFNTVSTAFLLEEATGFDSPNMRQSLEDLPEADGAATGNFYFGSRPITFKGKTIGSTAGARNTAFVSLQRALRGMRDQVIIKATAAGLPAMQVTAKLDNVRHTGPFVKDFMISMVCADPIIYSQTLNTTSGTGSVATSGAPFPLVFDIPFGGGSGATVSVTATNAGNFDSFPTIRITGPVTNPRITNVTTSQNLYLDAVTLLAAEYVDINMSAKTVVKSDASNLYGKVRFPASSWIRFVPGANVIELRADSSSSTATLAPSWRDSWA